VDCSRSVLCSQSERVTSSTSAGLAGRLARLTCYWDDNTIRKAGRFVSNWQSSQNQPPACSRVALRCVASRRTNPRGRARNIDPTHPFGMYTRSGVPAVTRPTPCHTCARRKLILFTLSANSFPCLYMYYFSIGKRLSFAS
jgi:hypothetical protein